MPRIANKEKFLDKLPEEFHKLLAKEENFSLVFGLWKLPAESVKSLLPSINEKLHPIFDWKFNKPAGKRGKKSALPYSSDKVKLASELLKSNAGVTVNAEGGMSGNLITVQVTAKLNVNGKTKFVSINNIENIG